MNFDEIKQKMDSVKMDEVQLPTSIKGLATSKMPILKVKQSMRSEIFIQLAIIVMFFVIPSYIEMHPLPEAIYYILMFITSLITLGYLLKMSLFLKKSIHLSDNSKETVVTFISELKLTLEVYKTAIISGSLLLPLSLLTLYFGRVEVEIELFTNLILLNVPFATLTLYILGYITVAIIVYFITVSWSNKLYGVHIENLESILKEFDV